MQLETLPVAIQHPQQRRIDKPVARFAPFRLRETGDLHCQRKPESLECTDSRRIKQSPLCCGVLSPFFGTLNGRMIEQEFFEDGGSM